MECGCSKCERYREKYAEDEEEEEKKKHYLVVFETGVMVGTKYCPEFPGALQSCAPLRSFSGRCVDKATIQKDYLV